MTRCRVPRAASICLIVAWTLAAHARGDGGDDAHAEPATSEFPPSQADAAGARVLTIEDALALSGRAFGARRGRAVAETASAAELEAGLRLAPTVSARAGYSGVDGRTQSSSSGELDRASFTTSAPWLRLSYSWNPFERAFAFLAAGHATEAARCGADAAALGARLVVVEQYYALADASERLRARELAMADARELERIVETLSRLGQARGEDLSRAHATVAASEQGLLRARRDARLASVRLAATLDLDTSAPLATADTPGARTAATGPAPGTVDDRPEVRSARERIDAATDMGRATWASVLAPATELFVEPGALGTSYADLEPRTAYGVGVLFTIAPDALARAWTYDTRVHEAEVALEEARRLAEAELRAAVDDLELSLARVEPAHMALQSAEDGYRIASVRYKNGGASLLDMLDAQRELLSARLDYTEALVDVARSRARLAVLQGG